MYELESINFSAMRRHFVNEILVMLILVNMTNLMFTAFISKNDSWLPLMNLQMGLLASLSLVCLLRNKISYHFKITTLLLVAWLAYISELICFGPTAIVGMFGMLFIIIAMLFLRRQTSILLIALSIFSSCLIGISANQHWQLLPVPLTEQLNPTIHWLYLFWGFNGFSLVIAYIGWRLKQEILADEAKTNRFTDRQNKIMAYMPGFIYQFVLHADGSASMPYASEGLERCFGVSLETVKTDASALFNRIHPEDASSVWASIELSKQTMSPAYAAFRIIHPQQGLIWLDYTSTPERLSNNGDILWNGFIKDITDRKRAEQRLTATLENTPNVAVQWYDQNARVLYWNNASETMLGWSQNEALGKTVDQLMNTLEEKRRLLAIFKEIRENGTTFTKQTSQCRHQNQQLLTLSSSFFAIPNSEQPIYVCMAIEITDQQLAKQALQAAKLEAELANQAKSEFLANISHELRTPLNSIIGFAQLLGMGQLSPLTDDQKNAVTHIFNSGHHLLSLINEILDLARIESGKINLNVENVQLKSIVEEVVSLATSMAIEKQILISSHHDSNYFIYADPARVRQILLNLVSNAIKYNRQGGSIIISSVIADNMIRIIVSDTGIGISERYRTEVFKPFRRLAAENSTIEGTGIGLVICKQLVEAMNGSIDFESILGIGSRFWINLPRTISQQNELPKIPRHPESLAAPILGNAEIKGRILYIEDSLMNINVMKQIFRNSKDIELLIAETAETGLQIIQNNPINVVLMDSNLPGLSGLEALAIIKANPKTSDIPVIAVSAAAMPNTIAAGLNAGFAAYLTKPFDIPELLSIIYSHLGNGTKGL
jgi:PAS domain S-box-containing protein